jgi:hypothetical protein
VRIDVASVKIGGVEADTKDPEKKAPVPGRYLVIQLVVSYTGRTTSGLPYTSWADLPGAPSKNPPLLTDNKDRPYAQVTLEGGVKPAGRSGSLHISPDDQLTEVLLFAPPTGNVEYLHLELPASAFGLTGEFRFHIPKRMIGVSESPPKP